MFRRYLVTVLAILSACATTCATTAAPAGDAAYAHLEVLRELQKKADSELYGDMTSVADWVENLMREDGSHAETSANGTEKISDFRINAPPNPYKLNLANSDVNPKVTVHFSHQAGLTDFQVRQYMKKPPESWKQSPGTVTVISNGENMFLIWGAGADGRPIMNYKTGETRVVVRHWDR